MMRCLFLVQVLLFFCFLTQSQTLFTYGNQKTDLKEFLRSYEKTITGSVSNREQSIREYLDLYIVSRLKIQEAKSRGFDTSAQFRDELNLLRNQVVDNYMQDADALNTLLDEAFTRSQKDIQAGHIFIPVAENNSDSATARKKAEDAWKELKSGKSFEETARKYSSDPAVKDNNGNLGYISVFALPYEFESLVYSLNKNQYTAPYKSALGYHIFKNLGERKAAGQIQLSQILLAIPPDTDEAGIQKLSLLADSIYSRLKAGDAFETLAGLFSNDYISAASGGKLPAFSAGTYDPLFENKAFSLAADSMIAKPFRTSHGFHIIRRNSLTSVPSEKSKAYLDELKFRLQKDPRIELTRELLYKKILAKTGIKKATIDAAEMQLLYDSLLDYKPAGRPLKINRETLYFILGDITRTIGDFLDYAQQNRFTLNGPQPATLPVLFEEYKKLTAFEYYRKHLEDFNAAFRTQMQDLKEGNLFFDIMMEEVWTRAQNDTAGLKSYFNRNQQQYQWKNSADAVIFYFADELTAQYLHEELKKNSGNWKEISNRYGDRSTIDSSRYELSGIPGLDDTIPKAGLLTRIEKNPDDNSASFALILKLYSQPQAKTFLEARGEALTDFQNELDKNWTEELKKKYPVKLNEEVLKTTFK